MFAAEETVEKTVAEIARLLDGEVIGDGEIVIRGLAGIADQLIYFGRAVEFGIADHVISIVEAQIPESHLA